MKQISLEPQFLPTADTEALARQMPKRKDSAPQTADRLRRMPFVPAYDTLRLIAQKLLQKEEPAAAVEKFNELCTSLEVPEAAPEPHADVYFAALQVLTALQIEALQPDEALVTAARLLSLMSQNPKRKDEPFQQVLGALLYDIALIHTEKGQFKQAERELEKSMKLFEKLAKSNPSRYGAAHILAQNASTKVYRSRVKQVNMLAHNQVATSTYLDMMTSGIEGATDRLVESLTTEGKTLAQMGRYREAVQYFSRALKYLSKIEPEFTERQLRLSVDLGEALLNIKVSREKGIHLLNTMLHKATKLGCDDEHRRIVDILLNAKSRRLDILGIWHKVFPR